MSASLLVSTIALALAFATPLVWAALGEIVAERSGVVNLGVEGMMIMGAVVGFIVGQSSGSPWLGLAAAAGTGALVALVHVIVTIGLGANQYVSGLAITILGTGLSGLLGRSWVGIPLRNGMERLTVPGLADLPFVGPALFRDQFLLTWLALAAAALLHLFLAATRTGLAVRAVGESPVAADAAGIPVALVRGLSVAFGGLCAGVAGGYLSLAYRPSWGEGMTNGLGWIALALVIFSFWSPLRAVGAGLLFGALFTLSFVLQERFSPALLTMLPYVATIVALAVVAAGRARSRFGAPAALGEPYRRGER